MGTSPRTTLDLSCKDLLEQLFSRIMGERASLDFPPRLGVNRMEIKEKNKKKPSQSQNV